MSRDVPRRRATDPQNLALQEFGLQRNCEDGTVIQIIVWADAEKLGEARNKVMVDALLAIEETKQEIP